MFLVYHPYLIRTIHNYTFPYKSHTFCAHIIVFHYSIDLDIDEIELNCN